MRSRDSAVALAVALLVAACGAGPSSPGDPSLGAGLGADDTDASVPAAPAPAPSSACVTDDDCSAADLCVHHVCLQGCRSQYDCATSFCNFDNDNHCFNEHGCNPPPAGTMCPMICWGYCDAPPTSADGG